MKWRFLAAGPQRKKRFLILLAVVCLLLILSFVTLSWLQRTIDFNNKAVISDFSAEGLVYFEKGDGADNTMPLADLLKKTPYAVSPGDTMIPVNLTDKTAANYIGNLRFVVKYTGTSPAYIRVQMLEQWTESDVFIESMIPRYNVPADNTGIFLYSGEKKLLFPSWHSADAQPQNGTGWYDNRKKDFCFYYDAPVYPYEAGGTVYMLLLNGMSDENVEALGNSREGVTMQMMLKLQAVQPNRYREFFGLDKLPWEG